MTLLPTSACLNSKPMPSPATISKTIYMYPQYFTYKIFMRTESLNAERDSKWQLCNQFCSIILFFIVKLVKYCMYVLPFSVSTGLKQRNLQFSTIMEISSLHQHLIHWQDSVSNNNGTFHPQERTQCLVHYINIQFRLQPAQACLVLFSVHGQQILSGIEWLVM